MVIKMPHQKFPFRHKIIRLYEDKHSHKCSQTWTMEFK